MLTHPGDCYDIAIRSSVEINTGLFCASAAAIKSLLRKISPGFLSSISVRTPRTPRTRGTSLMPTEEADITRYQTVLNSPARLIRDFHLELRIHRGLVGRIKILAIRNIRPCRSDLARLQRSRRLFVCRSQIRAKILRLGASRILGNLSMYEQRRLCGPVFTSLQFTSG